jgi:DNA-binding NarL/FixJ family response regulator
MFAHSLNWLGNFHLNMDRPVDGLPLHEEALVTFRELEDKRGIAETLDMLGVASNMSGDLRQCARYQREAVQLFRELNDVPREISSLSDLATRGMDWVMDTLVSGVEDPLEPIRDAEMAVDLARQIGWRSAESYALSILGSCLSARGAYERALPILRESLSIAREIEHHEWTICALCGLGVLYRDLLLPRAAQECLEEALGLSEEISSPYWAGIAAGLVSSAHASSENLARARSVLGDRTSPDASMTTLGARLCWSAHIELLLKEKRNDEALETVERLISTASNSSMNVIPHLWRLRGEALKGQGRLEEAVATLNQAVEDAERRGVASLAWRLRASLGRAYQSSGQRREAQGQFAAARRTVLDLTARIPDEALRHSFAREAERIVPQPRPLTPRREAQRAFGGLTEREREIASLIAAGKSSRAIADELVVSERTVEGHVGNILAKLGFGTRAQIAAWAVEHGLANVNH